jgi:MFS family permease
MIAAAVPKTILGKAFGFHRAMDHAGAVLGPLVAFALLKSGTGIGQVFLWSIVPGLAVLTLILAGLPGDAPLARTIPPKLSFRELDPRLRALVLAAGVLALAALPEAFMVLWATSAGVDVVWIPLVWALASAVKMTVVLPAGLLSDRFGRVPVLLGGWAMRVALLLVLATTRASGPWAWMLFVAYAASLAVNEAPERSLVGDAAPQHLRGTAFGVYHFVTGLFALPGALLLGVIWQRQGASLAFLTAAAITAAAATAMVVLIYRDRPAARG